MNATRLAVLHQQLDELPLPDVNPKVSPPLKGEVSHHDLLQRVGGAVGIPVYFGLQALVLVNGTRVVVRTSTRHEELIGWGNRTRQWYTHVDRVIADDLEDFADELGLLADHERVTDAPMCSRCRSVEVEILSFGGYARQCERCIAWSRATRADRNRCADCRRTMKTDDDRRGSRCNKCYTARQDRAARETAEHREVRLVKRRYKWSLTSPWERKPRLSD
jgi:hypothetical protein